MRGKKIDTAFVADFIGKCVMAGKGNTDQIYSEAEKEINIIDDKIREVEDLKKIRSKLKDVIITLGTNIVDRSEDKKILNFFQLSNLEAIFELCDLVKDTPVEISQIDRKNSFLIKEMLASHILDRTTSDHLVQGGAYQSFIDFYLSRIGKI